MGMTQGEPKDIAQLSLEFLQGRHRILGYLVGLLGDGNTAEDILQETWLRLARAQEKGVIVEDVVAWSRGTARHLVQHHWRSKGQQKELVNSELLDLVDLSFQENDTDNALADRRDALRQCLAQLPDKTRSLLDMKYEEGLSFNHMAERLSKSPTALMMKLSRIRTKLGECVDRRMRFEDFSWS